MTDQSPPTAGSESVFLTVIIPAFDEAHRIRDSVARVLAFLDGCRFRSELVVVLDGGRPGADLALREIVEQRSSVIVLDNVRNRGKGFSVRRGVAASRGAHVLFADADLSLPIEGAGRFLEALQDGADVAIASRALPASTETGRRQKWRGPLGQAFNWIVRRTALPGLHDTQCGFKAFKGPIARRIFRMQRIDRFGFDVEVLHIARRLGASVVEIPVVCEYHADSSVRLVRDGASMLRDLLVILWHDWRGRYDPSR